MASTARRQIVGGGGSGAPIIKNRRLQIDGGGAALPTQGSTNCPNHQNLLLMLLFISSYLYNTMQ